MFQNQAVLNHSAVFLFARVAENPISPLLSRPFVRTQRKCKEKEDAQAAELSSTKGTVANMEKTLDEHERNQDRK